MQKLILYGFVFCVVNFLFVLAHIELFQSNIPYISWGSIIAHIVLLIIFPYKKFIKHETKQDSSSN
jgi:hypothetical protein